MLLILWASAICLFVGVSCSSSASLPGTDEEHAYDALQRAADWNEIVQRYQQSPPQSLACRKVAQLAMFHLGRAGREAVYECLSDSHDVLTTETAALMMSDVYMQLGFVAMAQRAAFEGMVNVLDVKRNERALRRLTETALVMGQYELALKYISIVEDNFSSSEWVQTMRPMAMNPELIMQHPVFGKLRVEYEKQKDQFFL